MYAKKSIQSDLEKIVHPVSLSGLFAMEESLLLTVYVKMYSTRGGFDFAKINVRIIMGQSFIQQRS